MRYGSVCSGIEAATVAWHPLGWTPEFFSEIEPFPRAVLAHRFPSVPLHGDFTTIGADDYGPIDLLVGGTPCQSFSVAGLRAGLDDERGNLALEFLRLAQRKRPRWVVWENVPGVLSSNGGRDFGSILAGLVELGYGFAYGVLDAQYFGVPQRRRRVFVVGYLGDWRPAVAVLFEPESLRRHPPPRREAGQRPAPSLAARTRGGGGLGTDTELDGGLIAAFGGNNTAGPIDVATACNAHGGPHGRLDFESETFVAHAIPIHDQATRFAGKRGDKQDGKGNGLGIGNEGDPAPTLTKGDKHAVAHALRGEGFDASEDGTGRGTPLVPVAFAQNSRDEVRLQGGDGQIVGALAAEPGMKQTTYVAFQPRIARNGCGYMGDLVNALQAQSGTTGKGDAAPCVAVAFHPTQDPISSTDGTTHAMGTGSKGGVATVAAAAAMQVRRLTPRECERLQGFPDGWTLIPWRGRLAAECPDGPRYKAIGNSMAVPVMRWIGQRIAAVDCLVAAKR